MIAAELACLILAVYWEARSEPIAGQVAVAQVVMTRVAHDSWPDTVCEVIHDPAQFSFYWDGRSETMRNETAELIATLVASAVVAGSVHGDLKGATHYHANYVSPEWPRLELVTVIGTHLFYKRK